MGRHLIVILTGSPQLSCCECRTLSGVCWFVVCVTGALLKYHYTAGILESPVKTNGAIGRHEIVVLTGSPQLSHSECRTLIGVCYFVVCVSGE